MARIRTIHPEISQSRSMKAVSRDARLLFKLLLTAADDKGRARADVPLLAATLFPADTDAPMMLRVWLDELEHQDCIKRYVVEGEEYLLIVNWRKWQTIDRPKPSRLPAPPWGGATTSRSRRDSDAKSLDEQQNLLESRLDRDGDSGEPIDAQAPGEVTEASVLADFDRIQRMAERLESLTPALRAAELKARLKGLLGNTRTDGRGPAPDGVEGDAVPRVCDVVPRPGSERVSS